MTSALKNLSEMKPATGPSDESAMTVPAERGLWIERVLAYALPMSPPIAILLAGALAILRRDRLAILRRESWTLGVFALLGVLGVISSLLSASPRQAAIGFSAIGILLFCWTVGRAAIQDPRRFYVDLQRSVAIVGVLALLAVFAKVSFHITLGALRLTVVSPEHTGTVFGLSDNGLGPLLIFGGILALGRTARTLSSWERLEGLMIFSIALTASLALGVRNALWGAALGAAAILPVIGLTALLVVPLAAVIAIQLVPGAWPGITSLFQGGFWASIPGLLQGGRDTLRWESWQIALRMIRDHPLLGVGPWHFFQAKPLYAPGLTYPDAGPHSIYLGMAAEWGIPAALLFFGWLFASTLRTWQHRFDGWRWALVAGLASFLAMGIWDNPLFTLHISAPVFLGLGLAQASVEASATLTRPDRPLTTAFSPTSDPSRVES